MFRAGRLPWVTRFATYQFQGCTINSSRARVQGQQTRGREPLWSTVTYLGSPAGCPQWLKCDAPPAPRWLEPRLAPRATLAALATLAIQVPRYRGAAVLPALSAGRKDQAEIVDLSGPSWSFLHSKALLPKPPTSQASSSSSFPHTRIPSRTITRVLTSPCPHHKHTHQQAASSADTSDLITSYERLWCRLIPSYECLLVGLRPYSSNLPVQMTWPSGRGLLPSFETDLATWYGLDGLHNQGLSRMALLTCLPCRRPLRLLPRRFGTPSSNASWTCPCQRG